MLLHVECVLLAGWWLLLLACSLVLNAYGAFSKPLRCIPIHATNLQRVRIYHGLFGEVYRKASNAYNLIDAPSHWQASLK